MRLALSFTAASLFEKCPLRFHAERVLKIKAPPSIPMALGSFVHAVTDRYIKALMKAKKSSDYDEAERLALESWASRGKSREWAFLPEILKTDMLELVRGMREGLNLKVDEVVGSEIDLAFDENWRRCDWFAKDAFFRMKIDRLDLDAGGMATVWDLKTGRKIEDTSKSMQLQCYVFGVGLLLPIAKSFRVQLFYARTGALKEQVLNGDSATRAKDWIMGVSDRVEAFRRAGDWSATPGEACHDCPVFAKCPAKSQATDVRAPESQDEAERLLGEYVLVDRKRGDIQAKLKAYVDNVGPIEAGGMAATYITVEKLEVDSRALAATLTAAGKDPMDFLKADAEALKRLAKKDKVVQAELDKIVTWRPESRFSVKKAGDE